VRDLAQVADAWLPHRARRLRRRTRQPDLARAAWRRLSVGKVFRNAAHHGAEQARARVERHGARRWYDFGVSAQERPNHSARRLMSAKPGGWNPATGWARPLHAVGVALTLLGLVFTAHVILENAALSQLNWDARLWACLLLASAGYALLSVLLVGVWSIILNTFAPDCLGLREAFALYATTQIMKYVPSNIVHFVGRHVALRRRGVPHLALVSTVLAEAAVLAGGASLTIAAFEADVLTAVYRRYVGTDTAAVAVIVGLVGCLAAALLWPHRIGARGRFVVRLMAALAGATLFFAATTLLISSVCRLFLEQPVGFDIAAVAATLAGAWVVGFVIPGASAGIGVREAAVILLLSPVLGADDAAVIATIYRLVTAGGDALFAVLGELARRSARLRFLAH
jgi:hypothetical protein